MATTIDIENAKQIRAPMDVLIQVTPESGDPIIINNENLIDAVVSLRADLSIIDPTLPESEIEIHAYHDTDISDPLSKIPNETPLTYQAGYPGDMSPVRMFYIDDQITWENNVITIHAVDAVHKLDKDMTEHAYSALRSADDDRSASLTDCIIDAIWSVQDCGIDIRQSPGNFFHCGPNGVTHVDTDITHREHLANVMNLVRIKDIDPAYSNWNYTDVFLNYVDAGIPSLTWQKPEPSYDIMEEDCGSVTRKTERKITKIVAQNKQVALPDTSWPYDDGTICGSVEWLKGKGAFVSLDPHTNIVGYGVNAEDAGLTNPFDERYICVIPSNNDGYDTSQPGWLQYTSQNGTKRDAGNVLMNSNSKQGHVLTAAGDVIYTQVVPWSARISDDPVDRFMFRTQAAAWQGLVQSGYISSDSETTTLDIFGDKLSISPKEDVYASSRDTDGVTAYPEKTSWSGTVMMGTNPRSGNPIRREEALPKAGFEQLLNRSNVTGSFAWKGDPRMQPRDVFNFIGLSYDLATEDDDLITDENGNVLGGGSVTECTIESITLTHEGGGTTAEITYREGIC